MDLINKYANSDSEDAQSDSGNDKKQADTEETKD
jgi:hypothetical protein